MSETKKSLGQHWLHDKAVLRSIVEAGDINSEDTVLEIGPGRGTLTKVLLDTGTTVQALEFDQDLIPFLKKEFSSNENFSVEEGDIRKFDYGSLPKKYKIIANIPYYLTSNLIRAISETANPPVIAVLLIQKEVAERICAGPGHMGILSITAQFYFECSLGIVVPASLFTPPPKVDSQVVILEKRDEKLFDVEERDFFKFIKAGFSEKRKTLRNSLSGGLHLPKNKVEGLLQEAGLDQNARAQELSMQQWHELYLLYAAQ